MMGTCCGDIDPSIIPYIAQRENKSPDAMNKLISSESSLLSVSGISNDYRDVEQAAKGGNAQAKNLH